MLNICSLVILSFVFNRIPYIVGFVCVCVCVTKELFDSRRDYERIVRNQFRSRGGKNKKNQWKSYWNRWDQLDQWDEWFHNDDDWDDWSDT